MESTARRRATVSDLDAFDEGERVQIIDGELIQESMTSFEHGDAQASICAELKSRFRGEGPPGGAGGWWLATEVDVVYADDQVLRHDLAGWRKSRVHGRPSGPRVFARPDWVCEILSTNRNRDLVAKRRILHQQGVPHYWIMDLEEPLLTIHRHHADGYLIVATVAPGETARLEPFGDVELDVAQLFGDLS